MVSSPRAQVLARSHLLPNREQVPDLRGRAAREQFGIYCAASREDQARLGKVARLGAQAAEHRLKTENPLHTYNGPEPNPNFGVTIATRTGIGRRMVGALRNGFEMQALLESWIAGGLAGRKPLTVPIIGVGWSHVDRYEGLALMFDRDSPEVSQLVEDHTNIAEYLARFGMKSVVRNADYMHLTLARCGDCNVGGDLSHDDAKIVVSSFEAALDDQKMGAVTINPPVPGYNYLKPRPEFVRYM